MSFQRTLRLASLMLAAVLVLAPTPTPAQAPQPSAAGSTEFTILIYERPDDLQRRNDPVSSPAYWAAYNAFAEALMRAGALRGGSALSETAAVTVRGTGSADLGVPGARLGGYFVVAAESLAAARRLAELAPTFASAVEIRPHRPNPTMGSAPQTP